MENPSTGNSLTAVRESPEVAGIVGQPNREIGKSWKAGHPLFIPFYFLFADPLLIDVRARVGEGQSDSHVP
jgi:hypothetical protein